MEKLHKNIPTPHITANYGDFAKTVLMPGDPLRAKFIAENFLEDYKLVNNVRGINGYTGYYKGKRVSCMASGMGQPSIAIYSYELFNFYDVDNIIRVGSCGSYSKDLHVRDLIICMGACSNSNYINQFNLNGNFSPIADFGLLVNATKVCDQKNIKYKVGNILSSDNFYSQNEDYEKWASLGVLGVEMETSALYINALKSNKKALSICTVSDSFVYPKENTTAEERQNTFKDMIEVALEIAK